VWLDSPVTGTRITPPLPATVALQASVSGGQATRVAFFVGARRVATVTGPGPVYRASWQRVGDGSYGVTAVATDAAGTSVSSSQAIVSVAESPLAPPARWKADFETGDWSQLEIGGAVDGLAQNWPYGYLYDGGRFGGVGGPGVTMVNASSDREHIRLGRYAVRTTMRQGAAAAYGQDEGGTIDAVWVVPGIDNEDSTWRGASNYRPGESRASRLPGDADVIGREVYWGVSLFYDPASSFNGTYYAGPDFHNGGPCGGPFTGLRVVADRFVLTVRGSNSPGDCTNFRQTDVVFSDDGSFVASCDGVNTGCTRPALAAAGLLRAKPMTKGVWLDFVFHFVWSDTGGLVQLWCQKDESGVYRLVVPLRRLPTLFTYMSHGVRTSTRIGPYFGIYRPRGITNDMTLWLDEIRRGATFAEAMIPGSRLAGPGDGLASSSGDRKRSR